MTLTYALPVDDYTGSLPQLFVGVSDVADVRTMKLRMNTNTGWLYLPSSVVLEADTTEQGNGDHVFFETLLADTGIAGEYYWQLTAHDRYGDEVDAGPLYTIEVT